MQDIARYCISEIHRRKHVKTVLGPGEKCSPERQGSLPFTSNFFDSFSNKLMEMASEEGRNGRLYLIFGK